MSANDRAASVDIIRRQLDDQRRQLQSQQDECMALAAKLTEKKRKTKAREKELEAVTTARQAQIDVWNAQCLDREAGLEAREKKLDIFAARLDRSHSMLAAMHKELSERLVGARDMALKLSNKQGSAKEQREGMEVPAANRPQADPPGHQEEKMDGEERASSSSSDYITADHQDTAPDNVSKRQRIPPPDPSRAGSSAVPVPPRRFLPKKPLSAANVRPFEPREKMEALRSNATADDLPPSERAPEIHASHPSLEDPSGQEGSKDAGGRRVMGINQIRTKKRRGGDAEAHLTAEDIRDDQLLKNTINLLKQSNTQIYNR